MGHKHSMEDGPLLTLRLSVSREPLGPQRVALG